MYIWLLLFGLNTHTEKLDCYHSETNVHNKKVNSRVGTIFYPLFIIILICYNIILITSIIIMIISPKLIDNLLLCK